MSRVALLMGGSSSEREISLKSGAVVLQGIKDAGIEVVAFDPAQEPLEKMFERLIEFDKVFIILHGKGGEDGVIQGALDSLGISYTGSGVLASALAMDKMRSKQLWLGVGLPTPPFTVLDGAISSRDIVEELGLPLMVKPAAEGSSIGLQRVESIEELERVQDSEQKSKYSGVLIAEKWIVGDEYTIAILGNETLPTIKLSVPDSFYDYEAKYGSKKLGHSCPCGLDKDFEKKLQTLALSAFNSLGCRGWGRVDFMVDSSGEPWLLEVNTVPGMTDHSFVPMAAEAAGMSFSDLVKRILDLS